MYGGIFVPLLEQAAEQGDWQVSGVPSGQQNSGSPVLEHAGKQPRISSLLG